MTTENNEIEKKETGGIPVFNVDPIMVLILGIVTCGLYLIYWNIKTAEVLNAVAGREVISTPIAVLGGLCTPVSAYFYFVAGKDAFPQLYKKIGEPEKDQGTLLLILGLFLPMAAAMIVQNDVNRLYK